MISVFSVGIDGTWPTFLDTLGQVANWKHTKTFPGGPSSATFDFIADPTLEHPALQAGRHIIARSGAEIVFTGRLEQPVHDTPWSCTVTGLAALAKDYQANNSGGNLFALNGTVDATIADGLPWTRPGSLTSPAGAAVPYSDSLDSVLGTLINQGLYWSLSDTGVLTTPATPPAPAYLLFAVNPPARTLTNYATVVSLSYIDSSSITHNPVYTASAGLIAKYGKIYTRVDLTSNGALTSTQADAIGAAILAQMALNGLPWSQGFSVMAGQLYTMGGASIDDLSTLTANITVRVMELTLTGQITGPVDVPIGQVDWDDTAGQLTLTPLLAAADTLVALLARARHIPLTFAS